MSDHNPISPVARRSFLARLGAGMSVAGVSLAGGAPEAAAQAATGAARFQPARHTQDDWMDGMPGKHRIILDLTSPEGLPEGIRFAGNLFTGHKNGYGLEDPDVAIIIVLRHSATAYGYNNSFWEKHGKALDSKAEVPPTGNPYDSGSRVHAGSIVVVHRNTLPRS